MEFLSRKIVITKTISPAESPVGRFLLFSDDKSGKTERYDIS